MKPIDWSILERIPSLKVKNFYENSLYLQTYILAGKEPNRREVSLYCGNKMKNHIKWRCSQICHKGFELWVY